MDKIECWNCGEDFEVNLESLKKSETVQKLLCECPKCDQEHLIPNPDMVQQ